MEVLWGATASLSKVQAPFLSADALTDNYRYSADMGGHTRHEQCGHVSDSVQQPVKGSMLPRSAHLAMRMILMTFTGR